MNSPNSNPKPKRKGVWDQIHTLEHPESGLVCFITERTRGVPAYSFQIGHMDDKGFNKFIPCPIPGTIDVEHVVRSLAENARAFITQKIAEDTKAQKSSPKSHTKSTRRDPKGAEDAKTDKKGTRRGGRGKGSSRGQAGLSTLAKEDARAAGHEHVGPTERQREKKQAAKGAT